MKVAISILVSSIFIVLLFFCYKKYNKDVEAAYFYGSAQERAFDYWLITHKNKKEYEKFFKSYIYFDLDIINRDKSIKHLMDMKRYCSIIHDIKQDIKEYNISSEKIIDSLCNKKNKNHQVILINR